MPGASNILTPEYAREMRSAPTPSTETAARTGTPEQTPPPSSSAATRPTRQNRQPNRTADAGRAKLAAAAKGMAEGRFKRGESVDPESEELADPSGVSDSPAIAPTKVQAAEKPQPRQQQPQAQKPKEATAEEKADQVAKAKRVATAKRALARDGWNPQRIEKVLAEDENELIELGEHAAKRQADNDREYSRLRQAAQGAQTRNPDGTFGQKAEGTQQDAPADKSQPEAKTSSSTSPTAKYEAMIEGAKDEIGEPAARVLKSIVNAMHADFSARGNEGSQVQTEILLSNGFDRISTAYAEKIADDPEGFDDIVENWKSLIAGGRYGRGQLNKAWDDAAYMKWGAPDKATKSQRAMAERQRAAQTGRVDVGADSLPNTTTEKPLKGKAALMVAAKMMGDDSGRSPIESLRQNLLSRVQGQQRA